MAAERKTLREVALAYRRTYRRTKAEGKRPEVMHHEAYEAAVGEYMSRVPEENSERLVAAKRVSEMIAAAVNTDPQWFWHGPDV